MRIRTLGSVIWSLFLFAVSFSPAQALTVSPVLFDNTLDPGQNIQGSIRLMNETQGEQTYYASVQNFAPNGEEGQQTFLADDQTGLVKWIALDKPSVTLRPGESKDFNWSVAIPKDAEPGGHYAAIFFATTPPANEQTGVGIGAKTGVLMLVNVNGDIKESAKLESFRSAHQGDDANTSSFYDRKPVLFESRISNSGSVHLQPSGKIVITNMLGGKADEIEMNPANSRVLPNSTRRVHAMWGTDLGTPASFIDEVVAEWKGFALGRYTATMNGYYGKQRQEIHGTVTFWVLPWRLTALAVLGALALYGLIRWYNEMIVKRALKETAKGEKEQE